MRETAQENQKLEKADEIRKELEDKDVILEDKADGTIWKVKR